MNKNFTTSFCICLLLSFFSFNIVTTWAFVSPMMPDNSVNNQELFIPPSPSIPFQQMEIDSWAANQTSLKLWQPKPKGQYMMFPPSCIEADSLELVAFYNATGGDDWTNNDGWLVDNVSEWFGVTLSEDGCSVEKLEMFIDTYEGNNLIGSLPDLNLPNLKVLDIHRNELLIGSIPNFSNLPNLEYLNLRTNSLTGTIPDFDELPNLTFLDLHYNKLNGGVPNFSNLANLDTLGLGGNDLIGTIPNFSNMPNLIYLSLAQCDLTGSIPDFNLLQLRDLRLHANYLTDPIPDFSNLPSLEYISIGINHQMVGSIPNFSNLPLLKELHIDRCNLTGSIPNFSNSPNLERISLYNNNLIGFVPDFSALENLNTLYIQSNSLTFSGLEANVNYYETTPTFSIFHYAYQSTIPLLQSSNTLYVEVGGDLTDNHYTWYKDGTELTTISADSSLVITESGNYYVEVTNDIITNPDEPYQNLILASEELFITATTCSPEIDGSIWVTTTEDNGDNDFPTVGSLRAAIICANNTPGENFIYLDTDAIPTDGPYLIQPLTELPALTDSDTHIDFAYTGSTSTGYVELDGSLIDPALETEAKGLTLQGDGCEICAFYIHSFPDDGVFIDGCDGCQIGSPDKGNIIAGNGTVNSPFAEQVYIWQANNIHIIDNFVGTSVDGEGFSLVAAGNASEGIYVGNSTNVTIGGDDADWGNVISGNTGNGIWVDNCENVVLKNNYIGVSASGSSDLGNNGCGLRISNTFNPTIGGIGQGNVISGNGESGIFMNDNSNTSVIQNNKIGTDATGTFAINNGGDGIHLDSVAFVYIEEGNLISGNDDGIYIENNAHDIQITDNYIGTDESGSASIGNTRHGILALNGENIEIGGSLTGEGNVISGNGDAGIYFDTNVNNSIIAGNTIGLDALGLNDLGNTTNGVYLYNSSNNTIGGTDENARNIISGNDANGIYLWGEFTNNNLIQNNYIGTNQSGAAMGNTNDGIVVADNVQGTSIIDNVVSGNLATGIWIHNFANGNSVTGNKIGTTIDGTAALGNGFSGISLGHFASNNAIGGLEEADRNIISGNAHNGIWMGEGVSSTSIDGNYIGTDINGTAALANQGGGIFINGATSVSIGLGGENLISGNNDSGITLRNGASDVTIEFNKIGTNFDGTAAIPNALYGIDGAATSGFIFIGSNLISGNTFDGVHLGNDADNVEIAFNKIGTDFNGTAAVGNGDDGIDIKGALGTNIFENLISGNIGDGIDISFAGNETSIENNKIGTNFNGTSPLGNAESGIEIDASNETQVVDNLIGGNISSGILVENNSNQTTIQRNFIGVGTDGSTNLENGTFGIEVKSSTNTLIGNDATDTDGNTIAHHSVGIGIYGSSDTYGIRLNSLYCNSNIGITISTDNSPTPLPIIQTANSGEISGTATANAAIEVFIHEDIGCEGVICQGKFVLGITTADSNGNWSLNSNNFTQPITTGQNIVATATFNGNTSEFTECLQVCPEINPVISGETVFCEGFSTLLTVNSFSEFTADYTWSTGESGQEIVVDASGVYTVTVTDGGVCSGTASIEVVENSNPFANISAFDQEFCSGDTFSMFVHIPANSSLVWSNGDETQLTEITTGGVYTVTVTNENNCSTTASVEIIEHPMPMPVIEGETVFCEGGSTTLSLTEVYVDYLWSTGSIDPSIEVSESGIYSISVSDGNICVGTASIEVVVNETPTLTISSSNGTLICFGSPLTLTANSNAENAEFVWSDGTSGQEIQVTVGGTYSVTVTSNNNCSNSANITIEESFSPSPFIEGDLNFCEGGSTVLSTGNAYESYLWSTGEQGISIEVNQSGDYSLTVTNQSGCSGMATVTVLENQAPIVLIEGENELCDPSILLTATTSLGGDDISYEWSTGEIADNILIVEAGIYTVTVSDSNGCSGTDFHEVVACTNCDVVADFVLPDSLCLTASALVLNDLLTDDATSDGSWQLQYPDETVINVEEEFIIFSEVGDYTLTYTVTSENCTDSLSNSIYVGDAADPFWDTESGALEFCESELPILLLPQEDGGFWCVDNFLNCEVTAETYFTEIDGQMYFDPPLPLENAENTFEISYVTSFTSSDFNNVGSTCKKHWTKNMVIYAEPVITHLSSPLNLFCLDEISTHENAYFDVEALNQYPDQAFTFNWYNEQGELLEEGQSENVDTFYVKDWVTSVGIQTFFVKAINGICESEAEKIFLWVVGLDSIAINGNFCPSENSTVTLSPKTFPTELSSDYFSYEWSTGETTQTIEVSEAGDYSVTVVNADSCSSFDSVTIEENCTSNLTAMDDTYTTCTNTPLTFNPLENDLGDCLDITGLIVTGGNITLEQIGNDITYTPSTDFIGTVEFEYIISDCFGQTDTALVTIEVIESTTIEAINDTIYIFNTQNLPSFTFNILENDIGENLILIADNFNPPSSIGDFPEVSELGEINFVPAPSIEGTFTVDYEIQNQCGQSDTGTFTLIISNQDIPDNVADELVDIILDDCISFQNAIIHCADEAIGRFDETIMGTPEINSFSEGVALTTGSLAIAFSPNTIGSAGTSNSASGDTDLETENFQTFNACALEFDFTANSESISFRYWFGSEEYPEWVNRQFSDRMGIFISGEGFDAPTNIALVPDTNTPVGVDGVNSLTNSPYFVENEPNALHQYDGFTVPLEATTNNLTIGETYHIKIVIADVNDAIYDSGLFIETNTNSNDFDLVVSDDVSINLGASTQLSAEVLNTSAEVSYSWTPIEGLDNPNIPNPTAMPTETTTYTVTAMIGNCELTNTITITVNDNVPCEGLSAGILPEVEPYVCFGGSLGGTTSIVALGFTLRDGDVLGYVLQDASGTVLAYRTDDANFSFEEIEGGLYNIEYFVFAVAGANNGSNQVDLTGECMVQSNKFPIVFLEKILINEEILCGSDGEFGIQVTPSGGLPAYLEGATYTLDGNWPAVIVFEDTATVGPFNNGELIGLEIRDEASCSVTKEVEIEGYQLSIFTNGIDVTNGMVNIQLGESIPLSAEVLNTSAEVSYSWTPIEGLDNPNIPNPTAMPTETTTYTVTAMIGNCELTNTITITVNDNVPCEGLSAGILPEVEPYVCFGGSVGGTTSIVASGVTLRDGDVLGYVLQDASGAVLAYRTDDANFSFEEIEGGLYNTEYFVFAVAGANNGSNQVDLEGECVKYSNATEVVFLEAIAFETHFLCENNEQFIEVTAMGGGLPAYLTGESYFLDNFGESLLLGESVLLGPFDENEPLMIEVRDNTFCSYGRVLTTYGLSILVDGMDYTNSTLFINAGESVPLTANVANAENAAFEWTPIEGLDNPNIFNPTASPTETTTYTVTAMVENCILTATVTLVVNIPCEGLSAGTLPDDIQPYVCFGNAVGGETPILASDFELGENDVLGYVLQDASGAVLAYRTDDANFNFDELAFDYNTEYFVFAVVGVDNGSGEVDLMGECVSWSSPISAVFLEEIEILTTIVCENNEEFSIEVSATGGLPSFLAEANYSLEAFGIDFSFGETVEIGPFVSEEIVEVMDDNACSSVVEVQNYQLSIFAETEMVTNDTIIINEGESVQLIAGVLGSENINYSWTPTEGLTFPLIPSVVATPDASTTYTVEVVIENNCTLTADVTILVSPSANDCMDAIVPCNNEPIQYNSSGEGIEEVAGKPEQGCLGNEGEHYSTWVRLQIDEITPENEPLTFTIAPNDGQRDYDFTLYKANNCNDLGEPIRCSFAPTSMDMVNTGLNLTDTDFNDTDNGFARFVEVNGGEIYYLMIDNFGGNFQGFTLEWTNPNVFFNCDTIPECLAEGGELSLDQTVYCDEENIVATLVDENNEGFLTTYLFLTEDSTIIDNPTIGTFCLVAVNNEEGTSMDDYNHLEEIIEAIEEGELCADLSNVVCFEVIEKPDPPELDGLHCDHEILHGDVIALADAEINWYAGDTLFATGNNVHIEEAGLYLVTQTLQGCESEALEIVVTEADLVCLGDCPENLVQNFSFEEYGNCPEFAGDIREADFWRSPIGTAERADYFNSCNPTSNNYGVPQNVLGLQEAFEGEAYAGLKAYNVSNNDLINREFVQTQLAASLIEGQSYCVSIQVSLAENSQYAIDNLGMYFSDSQIIGSDIEGILTPQIVHQGFLEDSENWMEVKGTFTATAGLQHLAIGNFNPNSGVKEVNPNGNGEAYYYIDRIEIRPTNEIQSLSVFDEQGDQLNTESNTIVICPDETIRLEAIATASNFSCDLGWIEALQDTVHQMNYTVTPTQDTTVYHFWVSNGLCEISDSLVVILGEVGDNEDCALSVCPEAKQLMEAFDALTLTFPYQMSEITVNWIDSVKNELERLAEEMNIAKSAVSGVVISIDNLNSICSSDYLEISNNQIIYDNSDPSNYAYIGQDTLQFTLNFPSCGTVTRSLVIDIECPVFEVNEPTSDCLTASFRLSDLSLITPQKTFNMLELFGFGWSFECKIEGIDEEWTPCNPTDLDVNTDYTVLIRPIKANTAPVQPIFHGSNAENCGASITTPPLDGMNVGIVERCLEDGTVELTVALEGSQEPENFNFEWSTGETTQQIIVSPPFEENYWIEALRLADGCRGIDSVFHIGPPNVFIEYTDESRCVATVGVRNAIPQSITCLKKQIPEEDCWWNQEEQAYKCEINLLEMTSEMAYVVVHDFKGCTDSVELFNCLPNIHVVKPNPSKRLFTIELQGIPIQTPISYYVYDISGRMVMSSESLQFSGKQPLENWRTVNIDLDERFVSGMYFVQFFVEDWAEPLVTKLVKQE